MVVDLVVQPVLDGAEVGALRGDLADGIVYPVVWPWRRNSCVEDVEPLHAEVLGARAVDVDRELVAGVCADLDRQAVVFSWT